MTIRKASDLWPGLADVLALADEMSAAGATDAEVDAALAYLREVDFARVNDELRAAGHTEAELVAFWQAMIPVADDPEGVDVGGGA